MADFVSNGNYPQMPSSAPAQSTTAVCLGRAAPLIWLIFAVAIFGIGIWLLLPLGPKGWLSALLFALYIYVLFVILTRA